MQRLVEENRTKQLKYTKNVFATSWTYWTTCALNTSVQMYNTETNLKDLKEQKKKQRLNQVDLQELAEREEEA